MGAVIQSHSPLPCLTLSKPRPQTCLRPPRYHDHVLAPTHPTRPLSTYSTLPTIHSPRTSSLSTHPPTHLREVVKDGCRLVAAGRERDAVPDVRVVGVAEDEAKVAHQLVDETVKLGRVVHVADKLRVGERGTEGKSRKGEREACAWKRSCQGLRGR